MKQQRAAQSKIVTVHWKSFDSGGDNNKTNAENWATLFEKKEIVKNKSPVKSAVTEKLKASAAQPSNIFSEYAKFDANVIHNNYLPEQILLTIFLPSSGLFGH